MHNNLSYFKYSVFLEYIWRHHISFICSK
jgi:hypothetical protein